MAIPSNLYAEKIFAEHPISMWALDDSVDYISLISEANRNIASTSWTVTNGTATSGSLIDEPFPDSYTTLITATVPAGTSGTTKCVSPNIINFTAMDQDLKTFCVGGYIYSDSPFFSGVSIGFEYTDTITSTVVKKVQTFETTVYRKWIFVSGTFDIPSQNTNLRIVLEINYTKVGTPPSSDYKFYFNGITLGQWSEEFCSISLGTTPISLPSSIPLSINKCFPADQYGIGGTPGYYLIQDNTLKAKNSSIPIVYGGSNVTILKPNTGGPSLIVPGEGFLNELGKYRTYTVEFWMRLSTDSIEPKRIFGPIASSDGLYVEGPFLTLVIGDKFQSYFVGEWYRPMLVDIVLINNSASVLINGEEVISLNITTEDLVLPAIINNAGKNQDWLGFYSYDDVTPFEIDCIAIYSYPVPPTVAKRRWVYGQAVASPEKINSSFNGTQAAIDYTFADYTANYNYPDFANWDQGTFDNLTTTDNVLRTPVFSLPEINIGNKTLEEFYQDNLAIQNPLDYNFITFRPNSSWNSIAGSFNLPRFNVVNEGIHGVYGVFSSSNLLIDELLFKIYNPFTGNYFTIIKKNDVIKYLLNYNGVEEEIYSTNIIVSNEKYAAGINIEKMSNFYGGNVSTFFGNQNGLKMYVAGDETGNNQFIGKIYSIGLSSSYNISQIDNHFLSNGTVILDSYLATGSEESANAIALLEHTSSYNILPTQSYDTYFLDIGSSGYWEDYLPLSYLGQFIQNQDGEEYYDLDFIQINLNYPKPSSYADRVSILESATVKTYITFQYVLEGANAAQSSFTYTVAPTENGIIDIADYPNWRSTRFEITDNTIIYPRKNIDFNDLAIVYHLEFSNRSTLTRPTAVRRLEISSQVFSGNNFTPVNTRFGVQMFPYTQAGLYYDYKAKNPFSIYKGSTPYLYLNRCSGVEIRGEYDPLIDRGISIPINQTLANDYSVSSAQIWMRCDLDSFPLSETELFEITSASNTIKFFMIATDSSGQRAKIIAIDLNTGEEYEDIQYYWNNNLVKDPVMTIKEWGSLGISFPSVLVFDSFLGSIDIKGPVVFNNISYYQANNLQQIQSNVTRPWLAIKTNGVTIYNWNYWKENAKIWRRVLVVDSSARYGTDPSEAYKAYIGINKFIVDDNQGLSIVPDAISLFNQVNWQSDISIPV